MNDEELFSNDYRDGAECKALLKQIEAVITKADEFQVGKADPRTEANLGL